jgi:hypothetical protein
VRKLRWVAEGTLDWSRGSVLFWTEIWKCFLLQVLIEFAAFVVRRMVATAEDTSDITLAILLGDISE